MLKGGRVALLVDSMIGAAVDSITFAAAPTPRSVDAQRSLAVGRRLEARSRLHYQRTRRAVTIARGVLWSAIGKAAAMINMLTSSCVRTLHIMSRSRGQLLSQHAHTLRLSIADRHKAPHHFSPR